MKRREEKRREEKRREEKRREEVSTCQQKGFIISGVYLTNREMDVLACICNGYTQKSTAELLKISENTAKSYLNSIKEKANFKYLNEPLEKIFCYTQSCLRSLRKLGFDRFNIIAQLRR